MNRRVTRESTILREARLRLGLSQQQVATMAGMQIRQYQRFEYGEREVYGVNLRSGLLLCAVLELDPVYLVFNGNSLEELKKLHPTKGCKAVHRMQLSTEAKEK